MFYCWVVVDLQLVSVIVLVLTCAVFVVIADLALPLGGTKRPAQVQHIFLTLLMKIMQ